MYGHSKVVFAPQAKHVCPWKLDCEEVTVAFIVRDYLKRSPTLKIPSSHGHGCIIEFTQGKRVGMRVDDG
ncbi:hypothetical protein Y032_0198g1633 [Ancylostoma ceylanicum]|uniref:Uncharacterized protein n=1 Tax=Ancylostoma ceylanicum TaxID=53326 RepID=A0A016SND9_9BILA|nr:hypothetical protein Y032_0198g1633 [Ancylostoma ceylanicum]